MSGRCQECHYWRPYVREADEEASCVVIGDHVRPKRGQGVDLFTHREFGCTEFKDRNEAYDEWLEKQSEAWRC